MTYLTKDILIHLNRDIIKHTGGFWEAAGRTHNEISLGYLIEIVQQKFYNEEEIYPGIEQKAALYAYNIITRHIFIDGNKRTGMIAAILFIIANGKEMKDEVTSNEIVRIAKLISDGSMEYNELVEIFRNWIN